MASSYSSTTFKASNHPWSAITPSGAMPARALDDDAPAVVSHQSLPSIPSCLSLPRGAVSCYFLRLLSTPGEALRPILLWFTFFLSSA
eukprot:686217-Heterocapsa_arctica.AAC.1